MVNGLQRRKLMPRRVALGADILESLACIKSHNIILLLSPRPQALDDDLDRRIGELPNWVNLLIIKLGGRVKHILSKCCNRTPAHFLILLFHRLNKLLADFALCKFIFNDGRVPNQQTYN